MANETRSNPLGEDLVAILRNDDDPSLMDPKLKSGGCVGIGTIWGKNEIGAKLFQVDLGAFRDNAGSDGGGHAARELQSITGSLRITMGVRTLVQACSSSPANASTVTQLSPRKERLAVRIDNSRLPMMRDSMGCRSQLKQ